MNASTVGPEVGTQKTKNTATAGAVSSTQVQRIDEFIKQQFATARSEEGSGIVASAKAAANLGFVNSANSRYAAYLEAFRSAPVLAAKYEEKYPSSPFLPWAALHLVMKALGLWCELPEHYVGAVPPEQIPWMEIFELDKDDRVTAHEVGALIPKMNKNTAMLVGACVSPMEDRYLWPMEYLTVRDRLSILDARNIGRYWAAAQQDMFVLAPPEAFQTESDWMSRFEALATRIETRITTPPDDPIVIRFVQGGALMVAAWGDEAAFINKLTKELNL